MTSFDVRPLPPARTNNLPMPGLNTPNSDQYEIVEEYVPYRVRQVLALHFLPDETLDVTWNRDDWRTRRRSQWMLTG